MSQKTNPTSLRLRKNNQNFSCPWFADFFFTENYHYEFEKRKYIDAFLRETKYSKAFFSGNNSYKESSIFLFISDMRADRKEKQEIFKSKPLTFNKPVASSKQVSNLSRGQWKDKKSHSEISIIDVLQKKYTRDNKVSFPFFPVHLIPKLSLPKENPLMLSRNDESMETKYKPVLFTPKAESKVRKTGKSFSFQGQDTKARFLNWVENNFYVFLSLQHKDLYKNYWQQVFQSSFFAAQNDNAFSLSKSKHKEEGQYETLMVLFLRKEIRNCFLKIKQNYSLFSSRPSNNNENNLALHSENGRNIFYGLHTHKSPQDFFMCNQTQNIEPFFGLSRLDTKKQIMNTEEKAQYENIYSKAVWLYAYKKTLSLFAREATHFHPIRFVRDYQNVNSLLDQIVFLLEKRVSFRQITSKLFRDLSENLQIKGVRISCSGRMGGRSKKAQKAKMQSYSSGETSLSAFSSKLLFGSQSAFTPYGKVGVKLWICFEKNRC